MIYTINLLKPETTSKIKNCFNKGEFVEGKMTDVSNMKQNLRMDIKNNFEMVQDEYYNICNDLLLSSIEKCPDFHNVCCPKSYAAVLLLNYCEGMYYHTHNDYYIMNSIRSDYSCTVFISDPSEYEGGELVIDIGNTEVTYKLNPGEAVVYPTGLKHRVNTVKTGSRKVIVFWIQSLIQDPKIRSIYSDMCIMQKKYKDIFVENEEFQMNFNSIKYNMMRSFIDL